jgi:signal recognition particle receptor subunit beta
MAFVNFATREITAKIVYYGPGLGGKTTSLQYIHNCLPSENRGKMISLATEEDRTIYFDFLPLHLGKIQDFAVRVQLYTVPGQVRYNATRKLVLRGADGVVFVADSQMHKKLSNVESFQNMEENLQEHGRDLRDLPLVFEFNKMDLPQVIPSAELNQLLNKMAVPYFETCATAGTGVLEALKGITKLVFNDLSRKALLQKKGKTTTEVPAAAAPQYSMEGAYSEKLKTGTVASAQSATAAPPVETSAEEAASFYEKSDFQEAASEEVMEKTENPFKSDDEVYPEVRFDDVKEPETVISESKIDYQDDIQEVEPLDELVEVSQEEEDSSEPTSQEEGTLTFKILFDDVGEFPVLMERFEKQIIAEDFSAAQHSAKAIFSYMMTYFFPKEYEIEENEAFKIMALNVKFRRFLRFKNLMESRKLELPDLLYMHHFLTDLYLSIKEL